MGSRVPLAGLASQTLLEVTSERSTYVPAKGQVMASTPTVLVFSKSRLSIANPFALHSLERKSLVDLVGASVAEAYATDDEICIAFANGDRIAVSLRDEDFAGPEAAVYAPSRGPIVVFN
jgi:hypothetical protein